MPDGKPVGRQQGAGIEEIEECCGDGKSEKKTNQKATEFHKKDAQKQDESPAFLGDLPVGGWFIHAGSINGAAWFDVKMRAC